jgi:DNA repair exonuclease SbcCD nuclease subunit
MSFNVFVISDIHFYDQIADRLYKELHESFISTLMENIDEVGLVVIAGDLFHKRLPVDSRAAILAVQFIHDIVKILKGKPLRLVRGTIRHDFEMLRIFGALRGDNVKVIETFEVEEFGDHSILFIPEEYPLNWQEYYAEVLPEGPGTAENQYSAIIGHGNIDFAVHSSQLIDSERNMRSAPVFPRQLLDDLALVTIFGHVHIRQQEGNTYYLGSFTRFAHGEEEPKGWGVLQLTENDYSFIRIDNELAPPYSRVKMSSVGKDPEKIVAELKERMATGEKIKLVVDRKAAANENWRTVTALVREALSGEEGFSIDASKAERPAEIDDPEREDDAVDRAIADERPVEEVVLESILEARPNLGITIEDVRKYMTPPATTGSKK